MPGGVVVVLSGGVDSATLLYHLRAEGRPVHALSVHYGQRHARELDAAAALCRHAGVEQKVVDLSGLRDVFGSNRLSHADGTIPEGDYAPETMKLTTVPNRNMILVSIALGWASSLGDEGVAFGAHTGVYTPYPDCRPEFAAAMDAAARVCDWQPLRVFAPFVDKSKAEIVARGHELGVPFELTWSCYAGGERACGRCGTCRDRLEAFAANGLKDPLPYE